LGLLDLAQHGVCYNPIGMGNPNAVPAVKLNPIKGTTDALTCGTDLFVFQVDAIQIISGLHHQRCQYSRKLHLSQGHKEASLPLERKKKRFPLNI